MTGVWSSCCVQERSIWHQVTETAMLTTGHATTWWQRRHVSWAGQDKYVVVCCSSILYTQYTQTKVSSDTTSRSNSLHISYPGTRSSSTARRAMWVAAFWIVDERLKLEQNRLYSTTYSLPPTNTSQCSHSYFWSTWHCLVDSEVSIQPVALTSLTHTSTHRVMIIQSINQSINKISIAPPTKSGRRRLDPQGHCHIIFWTNW